MSAKSRNDLRDETVHEVHNRLAPHLVTEIVRPTLEAGGDMKSVLVLLETVVTGVLTVAVKLGGDEQVLDVFQAGVRRRMAEIAAKSAKSHSDLRAQSDLRGLSNRDVAGQA